MSENKTPPPMEIWVNVYNEVKPESWDIHTTEARAVKSSIGAPTHCYYHESVVTRLKAENRKLVEVVEKAAELIEYLQFNYESTTRGKALLKQIESLSK